MTLLLNAYRMHFVEMSNIFRAFCFVQLFSPETHNTIQEFVFFIGFT